MGGVGGFLWGVFGGWVGVGWGVGRTAIIVVLLCR